jgi:hypothetical protein
MLGEYLSMLPVSGVKRSRDEYDETHSDSSASRGTTENSKKVKKYQRNLYQMFADKEAWFTISRSNTYCYEAESAVIANRYLKAIKYASIPDLDVCSRGAVLLIVGNINLLATIYKSDLDFTKLPKNDARLDAASTIRRPFYPNGELGSYVFENIKSWAKMHGEEVYYYCAEHNKKATDIASNFRKAAIPGVRIIRSGAIITIEGDIASLAAACNVYIKPEKFMVTTSAPTLSIKPFSTRRKAKKATALSEPSVFDSHIINVSTALFGLGAPALEPVPVLSHASLPFMQNILIQQKTSISETILDETNIWDGIEWG